MKDKIKSPNRILWIDAIKGFAIIAVIFGHVLLGFEQINAFPSSQKYIVFLNRWIYSWHMPLFMFVSGITFQISSLKNFTPNYNKIRKQALNLALLFLLFCSLLSVLKVVFAKYVNNPIDIHSLLISIILPQTLMWYLWVLIIYYLAFPLLCSTDQFNKLTFIILFLISSFAYYCYSVGWLNILCIKNLFYCSVFFYLGIYFFRIKKYLTKAIVAMAGAYLLIEILYLIALLVNSKNGCIEINIITDQINALAVIIVCVCFFQRLNNVSFITKAIAYLGENSLVIYLLHTYFITICRKLVLYFHLGCLISLTICFFAPILTCMLITYFVNRNKYLTYIFKPILFVDYLRLKIKKN